MNVQDRAIMRAQYLSTPLTRLQELAPQLMQCLPDTVGGCAERLGATRREIEDTHEFALDHIANRGGRLVLRDAGFDDWVVSDGVYTR